MFQINRISEPTLLIDLRKVKKNILGFSDKIKKHKLNFQPHFKTHQSAEIGNIFREFDLHAITVSSLKMAHYFAKNNWCQIHIALPIINQQRAQVKELTKQVKLSVNVSCEAHIESCTEIEKLGVYIDLDPGYGRTGVDMENFIEIDNLFKKCKEFKVDVQGFYLHNGASYKTNSMNEVLEVHRETLAKLARLKQEFGRDKAVLFGDTPGCSLANNFQGITSLTAGNFVFYDLFQWHLGSCAASDIAVCLACPVLEKHTKTQSVVIHGGAVHLSKDSMQIDGKTVYGMMVYMNEKNWDLHQSTNYLTAISQEHGILPLDTQTFNNIRVGDIVGILPVHSCLCADSMGKYVSFEGRSLEMMKKAKPSQDLTNIF